MGAYRYRWAWLWTGSLLLAACGGGGGDGPASDAGEDSGGEADGGFDSSTDDAGADAGDDASSGDGGPDGGDGGSDAGDGCQSQELAAAGGTVASEDGLLSLTIAQDTLNASTRFTLCKIASEALPAAVSDDQPLGAVYQIQADSEFLGELLLELTSEQRNALAEGSGMAPAILRHASAGEAPSTLADPRLELSGPVSARGTLSGTGFVYLRALDTDESHYSIDVGELGSRYRTGEVFSFDAAVTVLGNPSDSRSLQAEVVACDIEPIEGSATQDASSTASCPELATIEQASVDLTSGTTVDFSGASAPTFFCKFPGQGWVRHVLRFEGDGGTALTVTKQQSVRCDLSGDKVAAFDLRAAFADGGAISVDPSYAGFAAAVFASGDFLNATEPFGDDGLIVVAAPAGLESRLSAKAADPIRAGTSDAGGADYNEVDFQYVEDTATSGIYAASFALPVDPGDAGVQEAVPFFGGAAGSIAFGFGAADALGTVTLSPGAVTDLALEFGSPNGHVTTASFAGGEVDAVYVQGISSSGAVMERWVRPADLPALTGGKRELSLLSSDQQQEASDQGLTFEFFLIGFFRVEWDEPRAFWSTGRVVPIMSGTSVRLDLTGGG